MKQVGEKSFFKVTFTTFKGQILDEALTIMLLTPTPNSFCTKDRKDTISVPHQDTGSSSWKSERSGGLGSLYLSSKEGPGV